MALDNRLIEESVHYFKKLKVKNTTVQPEDGFVWALEERDSGYGMTHEQYNEYVKAINDACEKEGVWVDERKANAEFQFLPNLTLEQQFGDFTACENLWQPLNREDMMKLLRAIVSFKSTLAGPHPGRDNDEDSSLEKDVESGRVISTPYCRIRLKTDRQKCPRCGSSIMEDLPALSRIDNKTKLCNLCGTAEAMEDYLHYLKE